MNKVERVYKLCYAEHNNAWFTSLPLNEQYGDDWGDRPYEHNAGRPCWHRYNECGLRVEDPEQLFVLYFDGPFDLPCDGVTNSRYSVVDINNKQVPWLKQDLWSDEQGPPVMIWAGSSVAEFCNLVEQAGGVVYVAVQDYHRLMDMYEGV